MNIFFLFINNNVADKNQFANNLLRGAENGQERKELKQN